MRIIAVGTTHEWQHNLPNEPIDVNVFLFVLKILEFDAISEWNSSK
jgi:hypothetical protein